MDFSLLRFAAFVSFAAITACSSTSRGTGPGAVDGPTNGSGDTSAGPETDSSEEIAAPVRADADAGADAVAGANVQVTRNGSPLRIVSIDHWQPDPTFSGHRLFVKVAGSSIPADTDISVDAKQPGSGCALDQEVWFREPGQQWYSDRVSGCGLIVREAPAHGRLSGEFNGQLHRLEDRNDVITIHFAFDVP